MYSYSLLEMQYGVGVFQLELVGRGGWDIERSSYLEFIIEVDEEDEVSLFIYMVIKGVLLFNVEGIVLEEIRLV